MIRIQKDLLQKEQELQHIIKSIEKRIGNYPKGSLKIGRNKDGNSYYYCDGEGRCNGKKRNVEYISRTNTAFIGELAQKSYDTKVLQWARKCHELLLAFLKQYEDEKIDTFYEVLPEARKALVTPIRKTLAMTIDEWEQEEYAGKPFEEGVPVIMTEKGERVRSKSEKILADKFQKLGIPYKYECPLHLKGYGTIFPDFKVLNIHNGKTYYWEHFGMMDLPEYAEKALKKIECYMENGLFIGEQLIVSFETKKSGMNYKMVDAYMHRYLLY